MLASTLYILKDDAVQQLSVLLLITELTRASHVPTHFRAVSSTGLSGGEVIGGGEGAAAVSTGDGVCMLSAASAMTSIMRRFPLAFSLSGGATEVEWEAGSSFAGASGRAGGAVLR